jgi:hypothetical protein
VRVGGRPRCALVLLLVSGCAGLTAAQQAAAAKVQIIDTEPAENCQNLGAVSGSRDGDGAGGIRGQAVLLGGNTVHVNPHATTAFYCPEESEGRPPPPIILSK